MPTGRGVLEGAFHLLDTLAELREAGVTQLTTATGLPKATVHRLLDQLVTLGAVHRHAHRYRIGPRLYQLGAAWDTPGIVRSAARHPLRRLSTLTRGASVNLALPRGDRTLLITGVRGEVDGLTALHAGALAPHGNVGDRLFATDATPAPPGFSGREWRRWVRDARETGLAFDRGTFQPEVSVVGAPVRGADGRVVAAVGVLVRDGRRLADLAPAAQRAADLIGANLKLLAPTLLSG